MALPVKYSHFPLPWWWEKGYQSSFFFEKKHWCGSSLLSQVRARVLSASFLFFLHFLGKQCLNQGVSIRRQVYCLSKQRSSYPRPSQRAVCWRQKFIEQCRICIMYVRLSYILQKLSDLPSNNFISKLPLSKTLVWTFPLITSWDPPREPENTKTASPAIPFNQLTRWQVITMAMTTPFYINMEHQKRHVLDNFPSNVCFRFPPRLDCFHLQSFYWGFHTLPRVL